MNLTSRQLSIFDALADHLHFGRSAAALGLSQPIVSQELQRMERIFGGQLFLRSTRAVELTELGRSLLPEVKEILVGIDELRSIAERHRRRHIVVKVAATPSIIDRL